MTPLVPLRLAALAFVLTALALAPPGPAPLDPASLGPAPLVTGLLAIGTAHAAPSRPARLSRWQVQRLGTGPGGAPVCAYYSGYERLGRPRNKNVFRRRACFRSRAQCRRWLYWAQSYYPQRELLKRCR